MSIESFNQHTYSIQTLPLEHLPLVKDVKHLIKAATIEAFLNASDSTDALDESLAGYAVVLNSHLLVTAAWVTADARAYWMFDQEFPSHLASEYQGTVLGHDSRDLKGMING